MATLVERIAARIPEFGIKLAYGDTRSVGGEELVPVAFVSYGFGAGEGTGPAESPDTEAHTGREFSGSGGGGGGVAIPVGAYLRRGGRVVFRPNSIALLAVGLPVIAALGVSIAAILRATR